jgi:hypothetical protein
MVLGGTNVTIPGIVPLLEVGAEESSDSDFTIEDGVLTKYTGDGGDVVIPEGVTEIGDYAFYGCSGLISVEIPDGVTTIGDFAFAWCESLASIDIPESVTTIGDSAFAGCESLTSIKIPESVTSIGYYTFGWCDSLTSIEIPEGVTTIGDGAFYECYNLTSIKIPESVTYICNYAIGYQFDYNDWNMVQIEDVTIYGYPGTAAETYAEENSFTFVVLDEAAVTYGDVSGDGVIDSKDAVLVKRYTSGWSVEVDVEAADVNGDGVVNSKDAVLIERYVAGWDVTLGK